MPSPAQWAFLAALVAMLALLHGSRRHFWLFSILVLPGTFAHEGCHLLLGLLLGGRPAGFNLLPRREGRGWEMGSVSFSHITWYNAFFIGMAPLLLLPAAYGLARWRLGGGPVLDWPEVLAIYVIANLAYAALPSWQDCRIAARSPIGWLLLAGGIAWGWHSYRKSPRVPHDSVILTFAYPAWE
ncbi:MAG: hypothetical protein P4L36_15110 [Holophaga sp.]|nr:hypothetical protein [Holophaga sp.]